MTRTFINESFSGSSNSGASRGLVMSALGCADLGASDAFLRALIAEMTEEEKSKTILFDGESEEIHLTDSDKSAVETHKTNSCDAIVATLKDSSKKYDTVLVRGLNSLVCRGLHGKPGTFGQVANSVKMFSEVLSGNNTRVLFTTSTRSDKVTVSGPVATLRAFDSVLLLREKGKKPVPFFSFIRVDRDSIADDLPQRRLVLAEKLTIDSTGRLIVS